MAGKRRFVGPGGAVFVPNVPEDTIEQQVAAGIWTPVAESLPRSVPAVQQGPRRKK